MEMKIDSDKIKQLREARAWSQEHLAEVAGLSARTVQRIETEGNASPESRMALATALGVSVADLGYTPPPVAAATAAGPVAERPAIRWSGRWVVFSIVCLGLLLLDFSTHGTITWSKWPCLGWGLGLLLHSLNRREAGTRLR